MRNVTDTGMKAENPGSGESLDGFTLPMAVVDALPVIFFSLGASVIALRFPSPLYRAGAFLVILAGALKAAWKFVIALLHRNVRFLNRQMRFLMPAGFLLILISLFIDRQLWSAGTVAQHILQLPSLIFFLLGAAGLVAMSIFAVKLPKMDPRANWIEQGTNTVAQLLIFLGILL